MGLASGEGFLSALPAISGASGQDEFLDADIDRSEFDKYLSGYGVNHATNVTQSAGGSSGSGCSYYGSSAGTDQQSSSFEMAKDLAQHHLNHLNHLNHQHHHLHHHHHHHGSGNGHADYPLIKSEPVYDTIPGASLSSALADVRSMYYDC